MKNQNTTTRCHCEDKIYLPKKKRTRSTRCDNCGEIAARSELEEVGLDGDTGRWCKDCIESEAIQCEDCGGYYSEDSWGIHEFDGHWYCDDCVDNHCRPCEYCDELFMINQMVEVERDGDTTLWCKACAKKHGRMKTTE